MRFKDNTSSTSEREEGYDELTTNERMPWEEWLDRSDKYVDSVSTMGTGEEYQVSSGVATDIDRLSEDSPFTPPRTTFYSNDLDGFGPNRYDYLWKIQWGVDTWSGASPLDEEKIGHRFDSNERAHYSNLEPILDLVPECRRSEVRKRARGVNPYLFNSWYGGWYGAHIGAALFELYDSFETFSDSTSDETYQEAQKYWESIALHRERDRKLPADIEHLAEYVFNRVWGDE